MVAIYTLHHNDESNQSQHIAYSLDEGLTWTKYADNPVLDLGMKDFRDPKVTWEPETSTWLMAVAKPQEFKIAFFRSSDLKSWNHLSDFGPLGATSGIWECPDLFPLPTSSGEIKWVLIVSLNPGGITGGSGTQYFIGDWDGQKFTTEQSGTKWIDYGRDNYAGVTFNNTPDNRRIFIGWMSNWDYAAKLPSPIWRTSMTSPRELALREVSGELFLASDPIPVLQATIDEPFKISSDKSAAITIGTAPHQCVIAFDADTKKISIDRSGAWFEDIEDGPQISPVIELQEFTIRVVVDHGSLELFVPEAALAMTCLHSLPASRPILQNPAN
jgi:sucrose-6-phosphate hydrolase SacC (GH32 family)